MNRAHRLVAHAGLVLALVLPGIAGAQEAPANSDTPPSIFEHPAEARYWISAQGNMIFQFHPAFHSKYSGANSLQSNAENATSYVATIFTGFQLTDTTDLIVDIESAGGSGLSTALGLGGFTNLDVVRNPSLGSEPYIARAQLRQIIPLSADYVAAERGPLSLATRLPTRRIEARIGKMSTVDFFDVNKVGSDSRLQFMNWTIDNSGAYDYAADTRGYTYGVLLEFYDRCWALRFAEALMPTVANGSDFEWNIARARGENFELELHRELLPQRETTLRVLTFLNHANMGNYRAANQAFLGGTEATPDIASHRQQGSLKYGFGINLEQTITDDLISFARWGWNEGQHESFAYTEVNQSGVLGAALSGQLWQRPYDKLGLAAAINHISKAHQQYLGLGGAGFILGDGALTYGYEEILETYYRLHVWSGVSVALDMQYIRHPGYNRDRGPVFVPGFRFHTDL